MKIISDFESKNSLVVSSNFENALMRFKVPFISQHTYFTTWWNVSNKYLTSLNLSKTFLSICVMLFHSMVKSTKQILSLFSLRLTLFWLWLTLVDIVWLWFPFPCFFFYPFHLVSLFNFLSYSFLILNHVLTCPNPLWCNLIQSCHFMSDMT